MPFSGQGCLKLIPGNRLIEIIFWVQITSISNTHLMLPSIVHLRTIYPFSYCITVGGFVLLINNHDHKILIINPVPLSSGFMVLYLKYFSVHFLNYHVLVLAGGSDSSEQLNNPWFTTFPAWNEIQQWNIFATLMSKKLSYNSISFLTLNNFIADSHYCKVDVRSTSCIYHLISLFIIIW